MPARNQEKELILLVRNRILYFSILFLFLLSIIMGLFLYKSLVILKGTISGALFVKVLEITREAETDESFSMRSLAVSELEMLIADMEDKNRGLEILEVRDASNKIIYPIVKDYDIGKVLEFLPKGSNSDRIRAELIGATNSNKPKVNKIRGHISRETDFKYFFPAKILLGSEIPVSDRKTNRKFGKVYFVISLI